MAMSAEALEARKAYKREWNKKNRERQRQYAERYWERKAAEAAAQQETADNSKEKKG